MFAPPDYSVLDRAGLGRTMFYPRADWQPAPAGATSHRFTVDEGVQIEARFYRYSVLAPTILFFHGNGEVASDYDEIAPFYRQSGMNLIVADYRGYGGSSGQPSFATMIADAHPILSAVRQLLTDGGFVGSLYVKGRSLGAHSAVELAAHYPEQLAGLITESGAAGVARMAGQLSAAGQGAIADELVQRHEAKVRGIHIPVLVMHGEIDELIPLATALAFYESLVAAPDRELVVIPGAGHNDILWVGFQQYFPAVSGFVSRHAKQHWQ